MLRQTGIHPESIPTSGCLDIANQGCPWYHRCIRQVDATPCDVNLRGEAGVAMGSGRLGLSVIEKREIWSRWKAGETLQEIEGAYGKCHNTIRAVLLPRGGRTY